MADRIEQTTELTAAPARVWTALTDHHAFGAWFGVALDGPFVVGEESTGHITHPGYEHLHWTAWITAMESKRRFAFEWHPYAVDPAVDYAAEPPTVVEFLLAPAGAGTRLTVIESGFDRVPAHRREEAYRMNEGGWAAQMENIAAYLEDHRGR